MKSYVPALGLAIAAVCLAIVAVRQLTTSDAVFGVLAGLSSLLLAGLAVREARRSDRRVKSHS